MGKNQSASNLTNIIKQDANGGIAFMSGSTMLMALSNTGQFSSTGSTQFGAIVSNTHQFTGSLSISGSTDIVDQLRIGGSTVISYDVNAETTRLGVGYAPQNYTKAIIIDNSTGHGLMVRQNNGAGKIVEFSGPEGALGLMVSGSGYVGIGTTSPSDLLSVVGSGLYPRITVQSTNTGSSAAGINFADSSGVQWAIAYDKTGGGLQFFKEGSGNRMYITNAGNVGIGTISSYNHALCVNGAVGLYSTTGSQKWHMQYNASADGLNFVESSVADYRLFLKAGGNVGIGTGTPSFKLDVSEAGAVINGTATIGSNMKGIRIYNSNTATNNNAVGLWFSTGPHQAGIASFRATADTTWETSIAFYTHVDTTSNLTDATEKMRISGQGYVTKPSQPSFLAASTSGQQDYTSGQVIVFNTTRHNTSSCYSTSTGRFTAPVAGRYLFTLNIYTYTSYSVAVTITVNGSQYNPQDVTPLLYKPSEGTSTTLSTQVIFELSANDYVEVRARAGYTARIYMSHSSFSGQLLS